MELTDYLKKLKDCPDRGKIEDGVWKAALHEECGVSDNWPVLLRIGYDRLLEDLLVADRIFKGKYRFRSQGIRFEKTRPELKEKEFNEEGIESRGNLFMGRGVLHPSTERKIRRAFGTLVPVQDLELNIRTDFDYIPGVVTMQVNNSSYPQTHSEPHKTRQGKFNVLVYLHPYLKGKFNFVQERRMLAHVIDDFGRYAIKNNIPLCFPHANLTSLNGNTAEDLDAKLVYYNGRNKTTK